MGFKNRLKLVKDETAPIERRVTALCNALTYCRTGYNQGMNQMKTKFNIEIGHSVTNQQLLDAAAFLELDWEINERKGNE